MTSGPKLENGAGRGDLNVASQSCRCGRSVSATPHSNKHVVVELLGHGAPLAAPLGGVLLRPGGVNKKRVNNARWCFQHARRVGVGSCLGPSGS